ncbi:MAG: hypothetical protein HYZ34_10955 [Ignavibacteriae bacterium]|nr:hypothetical protein [Ignavibacteriota bacterium]
MGNNIPQTDGERKKQASELIKNADKLLKSGDAASALEAVEKALQLDPGNLYAQAYRQRINSVLGKTGGEEKTNSPPSSPVQQVTTPAPVQKAGPPLSVMEQPKVEVPTQPTVSHIEKQKPVEHIPTPSKPKSEEHVHEPASSGKMRKLAAIMFTDMVQYAALTQTNESLALQLLDTHQKLIRPLFKKFDGKEIKTVGDAFLVEFVSVLQAVRCSLDIHSVLLDYNTKAPKEKRIQLRIGIHLGDIIYKDNDIFGDGVNIASRIQAQAKPGAIYVSQDVYNQIRNREEFIIEYVGEIELKHIITPLPIYKVLTETEVRQKQQTEATTTAATDGKEEAQAKKIQDFLNAGKEFLKKESLQDALLEVTKILQINSHHPEARLIESQIRNKRIELIGKQIETTKQLPQQLLIDLYKETIQYARQEGELTQEELKILSGWRKELQLSDSEHERLLKEK